MSTLGLGARIGIASGIGGLLTLLIAGLAFVSANSGHRAEPTPRGLVLRVEARIVRHPMDRLIVSAVDLDGPAIVVESSEDSGTRTARATYRFPDGARIGEESVPRIVVGGEPVPVADFEFDFDGDGVADTIEVLGRAHYGLVRVKSGRDAHVLFEHDDPLEYECAERAFALPDLDGDGCAELALVHPRMDRSGYDFELWDQMLGAKSWITVVSGRLATR